MQDRGYVQNRIQNILVCVLIAIYHHTVSSHVDDADSICSL